MILLQKIAYVYLCKLRCEISTNTQAFSVAIDDINETLKKSHTFILSVTLGGMCMTITDINFVKTCHEQSLLVPKSCFSARNMHASMNHSNQPFESWSDLNTPKGREVKCIF